MPYPDDEWGRKQHKVSRGLENMHRAAERRDREARLDYRLMRTIERVSAWLARLFGGR